TTSPNWHLSCRCGSKLCRHTVTGEDWRLLDLQVRYAVQRAGHLEGRRWTRSSAVSGPSFATDWSSRGWPGGLAHRPRSAYRGFEWEGPWAFVKQIIAASCRSSAILAPRTTWMAS